MNSSAYTEDKLVVQPANQLFAELLVRLPRGQAALSEAEPHV